MFFLYRRNINNGGGFRHFVGALNPCKKALENGKDCTLENGKDCTPIWQRLHPYSPKIAPPCSRGKNLLNIDDNSVCGLPLLPLFVAFYSVLFIGHCSPKVQDIKNVLSHLGLRILFNICGAENGTK